LEAYFGHQLDISRRLLQLFYYVKAGPGCSYIGTGIPKEQVLQGKTTFLQKGLKNHGVGTIKPDPIYPMTVLAAKFNADWLTSS